MTDTCISVHSVGGPEGHVDVGAVSTHELVLVEETDGAVLLENSGSSVGQSAALNNLLLGHRRKTKPPFKRT